MARRVLNYTVPNEGRDKGKNFVITEMSSVQGEDWAMRVILALMAANVDLPEGVETLGMAQLAQLGMKKLSVLSIDVVRPLLAEMFACVQYQPDPNKPHVIRPLVDDDIEEIVTRALLRIEVFELHTGFSLDAARSKLETAPVPTAPRVPAGRRPIGMSRR